jgi:hypothetical protein
MTAPAIVIVACTVAIVATAKLTTNGPNHQLRFKIPII